jgi:hypothetical protein
MKNKFITDRKELAKIETFFLELTYPFSSWNFFYDVHGRGENVRKATEEYALILTNTIRHLLDENERLKNVYHVTNKDRKKQQKKIQKYEEFINKVAEWDTFPSNPFRTEARELLEKHKTT